MPYKKKREFVTTDSDDRSYTCLRTKRTKLRREVGDRTDVPPASSPYSMGNLLTKSSAPYSASNKTNTTGFSTSWGANDNMCPTAGHNDRENKTTAKVSSQTLTLRCKPMPARRIPYAGYHLVSVADERRDEYVSGYEAGDEGDAKMIREQKLSRARRKKRTFKRYWVGKDEFDPKRSENIASDSDD